jgi:hypothetical protein
MTWSPTRRHAFALIVGGASSLISACRDCGGKPSVDPWTALIIALGPWLPADRELALEFAATFQKLNLPVPRGVVLSKLASRVSAASSAGQAIPFAKLSEDEQEVVFMVVHFIYRAPQVFGYVRGEAPLGQCLGDTKRHTLSPAELGW